MDLNHRRMAFRKSPHAVRKVEQPDRLADEDSEDEDFLAPLEESEREGEEGDEALMKAEEEGEEEEEEQKKGETKKRAGRASGRRASKRQKVNAPEEEVEEMDED